MCLSTCFGLKILVLNFLNFFNNQTLLSHKKNVYLPSKLVVFAICVSVSKPSMVCSRMDAF